MATPAITASHPNSFSPVKRVEPFYDRVIDACQEAGFRPQLTNEAFPASSVMLLVAAGVGVSMVPGPCRSTCASKASLDSPCFGLSLVWRGQDASSAVDAFVTLIRKTSSPPG